MSHDFSKSPTRPLGECLILLPPRLHRGRHDGARRRPQRAVPHVPSTRLRYKELQTECAFDLQYKQYVRLSGKSAVLLYTPS